MLAIYFHGVRKVMVLNRETLGAVYHTLLIFSSYRNVPGVFKVVLQNMSNSIGYKTAHSFYV